MALVLLRALEKTSEHPTNLGQKNDTYRPYLTKTVEKLIFLLSVLFGQVPVQHDGPGPLVAFRHHPEPVEDFNQIMPTAGCRHSPEEAFTPLNQQSRVRISRKMFQLLLFERSAPRKTGVA